MLKDSAAKALSPAPPVECPLESHVSPLGMATILPVSAAEHRTENLNNVRGPEGFLGTKDLNLGLAGVGVDCLRWANILRSLSFAHWPG